MTEPTCQYLVCRFHAHSSIGYTYQWDGEPLAVGDIVKVPDRSGDGWRRVAVTAITTKPNFETKPILGKITEEDE